MSKSYNTILSRKDTILLYFLLSLSQTYIIEKIVYMLYNICKQNQRKLTFSHLIIFSIMMHGATTYRNITIRDSSLGKAYFPQHHITFDKTA